jgi:hypothetical protein
MFHFLAESIQAYNQAGLFFGALICLSIGGFFSAMHFTTAFMPFARQRPSSEC